MILISQASSIVLGWVVKCEVARDVVWNFLNRMMKIGSILPCLTCGSLLHVSEPIYVHDSIYQNMNFEDDAKS